MSTKPQPRTPTFPKSSQYRGVYWFKRDQRWQVQIQYQGVVHHLGRFADEVEAARAYDAAAKKYFGDSAVLNFPSIATPQGYIKDGIGFIPLTRGLWALCDAQNFHWLSQWNWYANFATSSGHWYAQRTITLANGKRVSQLMHRLIMGVTDPAIEVDHIDREATLDNRLENLRRSTHSQNGHNSGLQANNTSGVKGVSWNKRRGKWEVQISHNGKKIHLGILDTLETAIQAYNEAALLYHKEFAVLNFPPKKPAASVSAAPNERKLSA